MGKNSIFFGQPIYGQLIKSLDRDKIVQSAYWSLLTYFSRFQFLKMTLLSSLIHSNPFVPSILFGTEQVSLTIRLTFYIYTNTKE
jgi:hypothetical protein